MDYLVLDEGEITLPMLVDAIDNGATSGQFRAEGEKPDLSTSPIPRFDLLERNAYAMMAVQFSRGCPFQCEFCDIIVLYGRKPRTKTPDQLIRELEALHALTGAVRLFLSMTTLSATSAASNFYSLSLPAGKHTTAIPSPSPPKLLLI